MNIKVAFTKNGTIMGDFEEFGSIFRVHKPVFVAPQVNNIALIPILGFCEEQVLNLSRDELQFCNGIFTPVPELRNHYSSQFGSGIQLVS